MNYFCYACTAVFNIYSSRPKGVTSSLPEMTLSTANANLYFLLLCAIPKHFLFSNTKKIASTNPYRIQSMKYSLYSEKPSCGIKLVRQSSGIDFEQCTQFCWFLCHCFCSIAPRTFYSVGHVQKVGG